MAHARLVPEAPRPPEPERLEHASQRWSLLERRRKLRAGALVKISTLNLWTLLISVTLVGLALHLASGNAAPPKIAFAPLSAVPSGATFVATLDVARLRQSKDGAALVAAGREVPGMGRLSDVCGFDPTAQMSSLALTIDAGPTQPGSLAEPRLGLIATGDFEAPRLIDCAGRVIRQRGGVSAQTKVGSFVAVRDRSSATGAEIAARVGGPVLIGEGPYLRNMIDAADAKLPTVRRDEVHMALRRILGPNATLVATWAPKPGWLGPEEALLPAVASVRAVGLRVDLAPRLRAHAVVGCAEPGACAKLGGDVKPLLVQLLAPVVSQPMAVLFAERLTVSMVAQELHLALVLSHHEMRLLTELLLSRPEATTPAAPTAPPTSTAPPLAADEVLRPAPSARRR